MRHNEFIMMFPTFSRLCCSSTQGLENHLQLESKIITLKMIEMGARILNDFQVHLQQIFFNTLSGTQKRTVISNHYCYNSHSDKIQSEPLLIFFC